MPIKVKIHSEIKIKEFLKSAKGEKGANFAEVEVGL